MDQQWKIEMYETATGNKPVEEFIDSLEHKTKLKVVRVIELLETFGLEA